jgi:histidinol dehydrogenase
MIVARTGPPLSGLGPEGLSLAKEIGAGPMASPAMHVIERFPEHELAIERLARSSESFRSMCEDYAVGVEALRRWQRGTDATDPKRAVMIAELRASLAELETEILQALEEAAHRSG